jgi:hypothetical protein
VENKMTEKLYQRYDALDEDEGMTEYDIETLDQMRNWLADFWKENPNEEMDEEEHEELIAEILEADEAEMFERLSGIGYSYYHLDENMNPIVPKNLIIHITNITKKYFVESLEFINENNVSEMEMRIYRDGRLSENFVVSMDGWEKDHEKYVNILSNELLDK